MTVAEKVLGRKAVDYLRKKNARPKSKAIQRIAKELGINLPSPQELIDRLKKRGIAYSRISREIFGNINHTSSFLNAHKYGHSLRFETYKKLIEYAYAKGAIRRKIDLEDILRKAGL